MLRPAVRLGSMPSLCLMLLASLLPQVEPRPVNFPVLLDSIILADEWLRQRGQTETV